MFFLNRSSFSIEVLFKKCSFLCDTKILPETSTFNNLGICKTLTAEWPSFSLRQTVLALTPIIVLLLFLCSNVSLSAAEQKKPFDAETHIKRRFSSKEEALQVLAPPVRKKLQTLFKTRNLAYPPGSLTLVGLKEEKKLLVYAADRGGRQTLILTYPIIGLSGLSGPKLKEGDKQVPEGLYEINGFRTDVIAYMALKVAYPNAEDRLHAREEKRSNLGGDILIHGSRWSTGCLAMGNPAIEELFVLVADTGEKKARLVLCPCNLLQRKPQIDYKKHSAWVAALHRRLTEELRKYPDLP